VEVRVHGGSKTKASVPVQKGVGKDMKRVRTKLLGLSSTSRIKTHEACLIELLEIYVHRDIGMNLGEVMISSIDNMKLNAMVKAMLEFNSKALILGQTVGRGWSGRVEKLGGQA